MKSHPRILTRRSAGLLSVTALATSALTVSLALATAPAQAAPSTSSGVHYSFQRIDNDNDPTFNQLLGINNSGEISGYFGSGAKGHPNKGYTLKSPYHQTNFRNQNYPHSKQTQVTGLNNKGIQVGFYSNMNNANLSDNNFGYYSTNGSNFHKVNFPTSDPASPPVDQLLGVNDSGVAVGFYVDAAGNSHAYLYDIPLHKYIGWKSGIGNVTSTTASGINDEDSICGFVTLKNGTTESFLVRKASPHLIVIKYPGASATNAFGVNKYGEVVGTYTTGPSSNPLTFGFTWRRDHGFQKINYPGSMNGTTFVNGINDHGDLVGFYNSNNGDTHGFLAKP
ncbi:MAG TPA: hypothetical protein VMA95_09075 [Streptosporangiaceae bacterium]|nr:hypothetical protein [Streptosporangiaceae bacterium]